ncbi:MAG: hypothetical protein AAGI17_02795 [Planctomycetota bacterium]
MNWTDRFAALDRVQKTQGFKIAASIAYALIVIGALAAYFVAGDVGQDPLQLLTERFGDQSINESNRRALETILDPASFRLTILVGAASVLAISLAWIWLGIGLTFIGLKLSAGLIAGAAYFFGAGDLWLYLVGGIAALTGAFVALLEGLRALLSPHVPVCAIARNVLAEAVRMRLSIVFIILLIFGMAALPGLLDSDQPLRYRVQSFITWGSGGSFWIIALLTISFGVSTVASEQRAKIIWQTMTKPVPTWQYILGKWIGVAGLAAVLTLVCSTGVFLFTSYLQNTRAIGEITPYVTADPTMDVSEDRLLLETRVLTARVAKDAELPSYISLDSPEFQQAIDEREKAEQLTNPTFDFSNPRLRRKLENDLLQDQINAYRAIPPGDNRFFRFSGLGDAREQGKPLTLTYRIDADGNPPDKFYNIQIAFGSTTGGQSVKRTVGLGYLHHLTVPPSAIGEDGVLMVGFLNGQYINVGNNSFVSAPAQTTMSMPGEGMKVSYPAGDWRLNHLRSGFVQWTKLAFLAAVAVCAGSFLSFPVASLLSFSIFIVGESSRFLGTAEEYFQYKDRQGNIILYKLFTARFTDAIADLFSLYGGLDATDLVVDGYLILWTDVGRGSIVLGVLTSLTLAAAVFAMKRKELAIYSGNA